MPKKLEKKLKRQGRKKFPGDKERQDRYVYGAMCEIGWKPSREKKGKKKK